MRTIFAVCALIASLAAAPGCRSTPVAATSGLGDEESRLLQALNDARSAEALAPLRVDPALCALARGHSQWMASGAGRFGHEGFAHRERHPTLGGRYAAMAESIYTLAGLPFSASRVVEAWLSSAQHRHNLLGAYAFTGIGIATSAIGDPYVTVLFARE